MSLARTLMNGGMYGAVGIDAAKYTHDNGATRIAIESVEELHEIFIESFYNTEQAELAAATEGVALENSQYQVVFENAVTDALAKVKEFLKKLWDKVKAFFHKIKRYIDAMFMSGKEFAKKYKKDIEAADKKLKDFSFKMFEYEDDKLDSVSKDMDIDKIADTMVSDALDAMDETSKGAERIDRIKGVASGITNDDQVTKLIEEMKKSIDEDTMATEFAKARNINGVSASEDLDEALFGFWRNGASSKDDKDDVDIASLDKYLRILTESKALSQIDSMTSKIDRAYKKAINAVDTIEKKISAEKRDVKGNDAAAKESRAKLSAASKICTTLSTGISREQALENKFMTSWKTALKERDTVYKQVLLAGISNANKNKDK